MTCDDCQAIVIDSARGVEVDRAVRDRARRHAALCSRCGEQQQEQQWLTSQFRAIAAEDATRQAPARVEIAVLAAWRAEVAASASVGASASNSAASDSAGGNGTDRTTSTVTVSLAGTATGSARGSAARRWMIRSVTWVGLAAAAMAALFVWPAWHAGSGGSSPSSVESGPSAAASGPRLEGKQARTRRTGSRVATGVGSGSSSAKASGAGTLAARESNSESAGTGNAAGATSPVAEQTLAEAHVAEVTPAVQTAQAAQAAAEQRATTDATSSASAVAATAPGAVRPRGAVPVATRAATRDTEFVALPYVEPLRATEARHVMRVSMTSGDEMILGVLPSDRRRGQAFEADVLVGEDGIARAIRVVRDRP